MVKPVQQKVWWDVWAKVERGQEKEVRLEVEEQVYWEVRRVLWLEVWLEVQQRVRGVL